MRPQTRFSVLVERMRGRRRLYAGAAAALAILVAAPVLVLVFVVSNGHTHDKLSSGSASTPDTLADAAGSPGPSSSPTPTLPGASSGHLHSSGPTRSSPVATHLGNGNLLATPYAETAFARGRTALVATWTGNEPRMLACYQLPATEVRAARAWSWSNEILVEESIAELPTEHDAAAKLAECRARGQGELSENRSIDLADGGYVTLASHDLYAQGLAGARVGRVVVSLTWRQSGVIAGTAPLEQALRDAVARVRGDRPGQAEPAPSQQPDAAVSGFLTHLQLLPFTQTAAGRWDGIEWELDYRSTEPGLTCDDTTIPTMGSPVSREWRYAVASGYHAPAVFLTLAAAADESTANADFDRCREALAGTEISGLGDEAFLAHPKGTNGSRVVYARVGAHYVLVGAQSEDPIPIARAALDSLSAAHRLS